MFHSPRGELTATFSKKTDPVTRKPELMVDIQEAVTRLLYPSRVCAVGLRNEWPEVCFERPDDQYEACLWIDSDWWLEPSLKLPAELSQRQLRMIWLGELAGQEVRAATYTPDGGLKIGFVSGLQMIISGKPSDPAIIEPWILSEPGHSDGLKVIGTASAR